ncbi:MAG TPA: pitrilysin family protein [Bacteroidales bacterium]|nr:pitrilysin family protein [Bacteroidales bacterium]HPS26679.1 pitrilysin family protein [Bacteroidales bacterium]
MIKYSRYILDNGLKVIVHQDKSTPMVAVNILYDVGARDEHPDKTGFAHLFEHLMFGGSKNIPSYDYPLQLAGGENNAFTNNDFTNYYLSIPVQNIETAFWLESDRMLDLAFSPKSLDVQRNVVIEEFKQRYLNQPYGDFWLLMRPHAYKKHPYRWSTIGKDISHIAGATMQDVKDFYEKYYNPCNAILSVVGNITGEEVLELCHKWFSPIQKGTPIKRKLPKEPVQKEKRILRVERDVPFDMICMAYHMGCRMDKDYYATDLLSDVLSAGNSSRLYNRLVKEKQLFSDLDAYITGDVDDGLFVFSGKLMQGVDMEMAEKAIQDEISHIKQHKVPEKEHKKVLNYVRSTLEFSNISILNRALRLAVSELLGDIDMVNSETQNYSKVTSSDIQQAANKVLVDKNCSVMYYMAAGKRKKNR